MIKTAAKTSSQPSTSSPTAPASPGERLSPEVLEIPLGVVLTPQNLERLLRLVNTRLRAQAAEGRPRLRELRRALTQVEPEIANYTRAVGRGDFASLETALATAEQRRATLQAELARLNGGQSSATIQLTPAALELHLQGMTERLRSGVNGKVREALQQSIARILVGVDGSLTIEAKPGGLLGLEEDPVQLDGQEGLGVPEPGIVSPEGRQWRVRTVA